MKKLISLILSLVMLAMPVLSMAEGNPGVGVIGGADGPTHIFLSEEIVTAESMLADAIAAGRKVTMTVTVPEVEGIDTGDATANTAITDLLEALGLYVSMQGDEYNMGLALSEQDVLTAGWAVNGEDVYVKSNLIGGTVVLSEKEIEPLVSRLLDMLVMMEAMTEEEANSYKEELPGLMEELKTIIAESLGATLTKEDLLSLDYSALTNAWMRLMVDMEEIEAIAIPRTCDPAVYGVQLSLDNAEFVSLIRACLQFVEDNPKLKDYIAAQGDFYTEEELADMWAQYGEWYMDSGYYKSEEAFRTEMKTFDQVMADAFRLLEDAKALDGEFVTAVYLDEDGKVVYLTSTLPMFTEEEALYETAETAEVKGTTEILNVVYTRQSVAQGVSHVCNIDVDGEGATIDVLVREDGASIRLGDMASQETLLTIDAVVENGVVNGTFVSNEAEETVFSGSFSCAHSTSDEHFKTDITFDMTSIFTPDEDASAEAPSINGLTLPGYEAAKPKAETNTLSIAYVVDYARSGVDVNGKEQITVKYNDVRVVAECGLTTEEPVDSIMSGEVVRPAELDDAAFANWFVRVVNSLNSWTATLITALPESVLTLVLSTGMM